MGNQFKIIEKDIPILQVSGTGTQFILLHKRSYAKILADLSPTDPIVSIDNYYKDNFPPRYFVTYPHIATQINGMSSINGLHRNVQKLFTKTNKTLKNLYNNAKRHLSRRSKNKQG